MKKSCLVILLCYLPHITVFSAQKESSREKQHRETMKLIEARDKQAYEQRSREERIKIQLYRENSREIDLLKKNHTDELALYENKIASLMAKLETTQRIIHIQEARIKELQSHTPPILDLD